MKSLYISLLALSITALSSCTTPVVSKIASATMEKKTPKHYKLVKVKGKHYYYWKGNHYRKTKNGYVLIKV